MAGKLTMGRAPARTQLKDRDIEEISQANIQIQMRTYCTVVQSMYVPSSTTLPLLISSKFYDINLSSLFSGLKHYLQWKKSPKHLQLV